MACPTRYGESFFLPGAFGRVARLCLSHRAKRERGAKRQVNYAYSVPDLVVFVVGLGIRHRVP